MRVVHERPVRIVCHVCGKVYQSHRSLTNHLKDHDDIKQPTSECNICGKSFKTKYTMLRHVKWTHEQKGQVFHCPVCQKTLPSQYAVQTHKAYAHKIDLRKCHICDREFKSAKVLMVSALELIDFIKYSLLVLFSCSMQEHLATHTGKNLYTCAYCPKEFKSTANMYKHYNKSHPAKWNVDRKRINPGNRKNVGT